MFPNQHPRRYSKDDGALIATNHQTATAIASLFPAYLEFVLGFKTLNSKPKQEVLVGRGSGGGEADER